MTDQPSKTLHNRNRHINNCTSRVEPFSKALVKLHNAVLSKRAIESHVLAGFFFHPNTATGVFTA